MNNFRQNGADLSTDSARSAIVMPVTPLIQKSEEGELIDVEALKARNIERADAMQRLREDISLRWHEIVAHVPYLEHRDERLSSLGSKTASKVSDLRPYAKKKRERRERSGKIRDSVAYSWDVLHAMKDIEKNELLLFTDSEVAQERCTHLLKEVYQLVLFIINIRHDIFHDESNGMRLVHSFFQKEGKRFLDFDDMGESKRLRVQQAASAVLRSMEKFDPRKGMFSTLVFKSIERSLAAQVLKEERVRYSSLDAEDKESKTGYERHVDPKAIDPHLDAQRNESLSALATHLGELDEADPVGSAAIRIHKRLDPPGTPFNPIEDIPYKRGETKFVRTARIMNALEIKGARGGKFSTERARQTYNRAMLRLSELMNANAKEIATDE